jgi:MYXO-CTERM domain-containing protein
VTVPPGTGVPGGTVTFKDGATTLGTGALDGSGNATLSTSALLGGTHSITASYAATTNYGASASSALSQAISVGGVTAAVVTSGTPSTFGGAVTFTATLSGFVPATPPSGSIAFADGATALGTGTLDASGVATLMTSALGGGTHSITATYAGDSNYGTANASVMQVVNTAASTTAIDATMSSTYGQSITFTATVTSTVAGTPTGTVTFAAGATTIGTGTVGSDGKATFTTATLPVGTQAVTAAYGGDANYAASTSSALQRDVALATSMTAIAVSPNPANPGDSVTLTATVTSALTGTTATGSVTFSDGSTVLATVTLDSNGTAAYTTTSLAAGTHALTGGYGGDVRFAPSTSDAVNAVINAPADAGPDAATGDDAGDDAATGDDAALPMTDGGLLAPLPDTGVDASLGIDAGVSLPTSGGGGCGCRTAETPASSFGGPAILALGAAFVVRRRRSARR